MAECFRCGSDQHFINECDYQPPAEIEPTANRPHGWSIVTQDTYLAELEDTNGHPLAMRVRVGERPTTRPRCQHKHSLQCPDGH